MKGAASSGKWDLPDVDFTDQSIYIFFGTLPRLLKAFAHGGVNVADETGDTVLHRYASVRHASQKCLPASINNYLALEMLSKHSLCGIA